MHYTSTRGVLKSRTQDAKGRLNIKMLFYQYINPHVTTVLSLSYEYHTLNDGIFYWNGALVAWPVALQESVFL